MIRLTLPALIVFMSAVTGFPMFSQEAKDYKVTGIAFYNVENLFDTKDDPHVFDEEFTPEGKNKWTEERYQKKLENLSLVLSSIGRKTTNTSPVLIGLCEVENRQVLEDLVKMPLLEPYGYGIIHFDSPDERGIDVALLYQSNLFRVINSQKHSLIIYDSRDSSKRDYTRDQLAVSGILDGEEIFIIVNHWPSRSGGQKASNYKRENAAKLNLKIIDSIQRLDPYAKIINMGDFNDDPTDKSLFEVLGAKSKKEQIPFGRLYNPFEAIAQTGRGTSAYRDRWNLFDQIMISRPLLEKGTSEFSFFKASIFNEPFLVTSQGPLKNYPFRSFGNTGFTGGFSDHFPVYILLVKEVKLEPGRPGNP